MALMADDAQLLLEQCSTCIHPQEARPSPTQQAQQVKQAMALLTQQVKQAMALLNTAQYSPVDKLAQIYELYDQVTIREDGTTVIKATRALRTHLL
jgi:hypothetical protein